MTSLEQQRRFFAEEIEAIANLTNAAVVDALAHVPREHFLRQGPWTIKSESDLMAPPRETPDADPRRVYHNVAIALDNGRQLFNGAPGLVAMVVDKLALKPGDRAVHIGCGTGYYTALMAHCVGPSGRVLAIEVDEALAAEARANLASMPWVEVRCGDGRDAGGAADAIFVNAGVTHPLPQWLHALAPGGRLALPFTVGMTPTIGKGMMMLLTRDEENRESIRARTIGFVAIYSAVGLRDDSLNPAIGKAMGQPMAVVKRARLDSHDAGPACWLHTPGFCLSTAE